MNKYSFPFIKTGSLVWQNTHIYYNRDFLIRRNAKLWNWNMHFPPLRGAVRRFNRWSSSQPDGGPCERRGSQQKLFLGRWTGNLLCSVDWSGCEDKLPDKKKEKKKGNMSRVIQGEEKSLNCCTDIALLFCAAGACFKTLNEPDNSCKHAISHGSNTCVSMAKGMHNHYHTEQSTNHFTVVMPITPRSIQCFSKITTDFN